MSIQVIIAGGRDFNNYSLLEKEVDKILKDQEQPIIILSGGARGADAWGEEYAAQHHYKIKQYPAHWGIYGKRAGLIRNEQMAKNGDILIAFWNGVSRGTAHMIKIAKEHGLEVHVIQY